MAQSTTYNVVGQREDLMDVLTILDPEATPILSAIPKISKPGNTFIEWQMDRLNPVNFSGVLEGQDVTAYTNQAATRVRTGTYVQKFRETWMVSDMEEASNVAGVPSEVAAAKVKASKCVKRSIEAAIGSDNDQQADNGTVPYKLRGLGTWIDNDGPSNIDSNFWTPSGSINTTATASLTEVLFNSVFQSIWTQTGEKKTFTLYAGPNLKKYISLFQRQEGTTTAKSYMVTQDAKEHKIDLMVDIYQGDFARVEIIPTLMNGLVDGADPTTTTNQQLARGYVLDHSLLGFGYMIGMSSVEHPNLGGGRRGAVECVGTLMVKNPKGLGKFAATS